MSIRINISVSDSCKESIEENKKLGLKFNISKICDIALHSKMIKLRNEIKLDDILEELNEEFSGKEIIEFAMKKFEK